MEEEIGKSQDFLIKDPLRRSSNGRRRWFFAIGLLCLGVFACFVVTLTCITRVASVKGRLDHIGGRLDYIIFAMSSKNVTSPRKGRLASLGRNQSKLEGITKQESSKLEGIIKQESSKLEGITKQESSKLEGIIKQESSKLEGITKQESSKLEGITKQESSKLEGIIKQESSKLEGIIKEKSSKLRKAMGDEIRRVMANKTSILKQQIDRNLLVMEALALVTSVSDIGSDVVVISTGVSRLRSVNRDCVFSDKLNNAIKALCNSLDCIKNPALVAKNMTECIELTRMKPCLQGLGPSVKSLISPDCYNDGSANIEKVMEISHSEWKDRTFLTSSYSIECLLAIQDIVTSLEGSVHHTNDITSMVIRRLGLLKL